MRGNQPLHVAVTVWNNRISPVFDSAQALLVAEIQGTEIVDAVVKAVPTSIFDRFLSLLEEHDVKVLICGALCEGPALMIERQGIEVISFVTGEAENVLESYLKGKDLTEFTMPGCGRGRCCRTSGRNRRMVDV